MEGTRHSVGMAVLGALAARLGVADRWRGDRRVFGEVILSEFQDTGVVLLRPRLLMNVNGVSVAKAGELISVSGCFSAGAERLVWVLCLKRTARRLNVFLYKSNQKDQICLVFLCFYLVCSVLHLQLSLI